MAQVFQSDFIQRADAVTNKHLQHVNNATASLNSIMASLKQSASIQTPTITDITAENEPDYVNFVPSKDVVAIFKDDYHGELSQLRDWFSDLKTDAAETFFPFLNHPSNGAVDVWILKALDGTAINLLEDAELARGRSRAWEEATRAKRTAAAGYAALGYALPGGPMVGALQEANFSADRTVGEANRDIAIKAQEVRIELAKFAAGQVNQLRSVAAQSLTNYLQAFASLPGSAAQYAAQKQKAQEDLWAAGARYYEERMKFKGMTLDMKKANQQGDITEATMKVSIRDKEIERDMKSLQVAADVYGKLVAGAMAGINSHISLSASNGASDSYSHSWSKSSQGDWT